MRAPRSCPGGTGSGPERRPRRGPWGEPQGDDHRAWVTSKDGGFLVSFVSLVAVGFDDLSWMTPPLRAPRVRLLDSLVWFSCTVVVAPPRSSLGRGFFVERSGSAKRQCHAYYQKGIRLEEVRGLARGNIRSSARDPDNRLLWSVWPAPTGRASHGYMHQYLPGHVAQIATMENFLVPRAGER